MFKHNQATQERIYQFIADFVRAHEMPPSVRMISSELKMSSSNAHYYLKSGEESGRLRKVGKDRHVAYLPANVRIVVE